MCLPGKGPTRVFAREGANSRTSCNRSSRLSEPSSSQLARRLVSRGSGTIMSITVAPTPVPYHGGFGVACAAIEGLWRRLAAELGPHGVRLVILRSAGSPDAPDVLETFEHHAAAGGTTPEAFLREVSGGTLLRRLPMLAEVADAARIMASDRASATTGAFANVTCGYWVDAGR